MMLPSIKPEFRAPALTQQAGKITEEGCEVVRAYPDLSDMAEETWDVIQAAQTLLEMLEDAGINVEVARDAMVSKNRARGRY